ncbi:MAG: glycosyltransferase, partial [Bacteroidota bacterium]
TESFGLAALEAMANKVAVISSNSGGIPEVNKHGVSGLLSDVGNIDEMAKNAIYLLSDDNILEEFKANAKGISQNFEIQNILPLYEEVYEKAYNSRYKNSY